MFNAIFPVLMSEEQDKFPTCTFIIVTLHRYLVLALVFSKNDDICFLCEFLQQIVFNVNNVNPFSKLLCFKLGSNVNLNEM